MDATDRPYQGDCDRPSVPSGVKMREMGGWVVAKSGIVSHEGMDATDRPYQGDCDRPSVPSGVKMRENAQNEANPESTQNSLPLEVESSVPEPAGRRRSQREGANAARSTLHARATTGRGTQALPGGPADLLPDAQSLSFLLYSGTFLMTQPMEQRLGDESLRRLSCFGQFGIRPACSSVSAPDRKSTAAPPCPGSRPRRPAA